MREKAPQKGSVLASLAIAMLLAVMVVLGLGPTMAFADTQNGEEGGDSQSQQATASASPGYLGVRTEAKVYDDYDNNGMWLNAQQVRMNVNEEWEFWPRRMTFIGQTGGLVWPPLVYPTFHFTKIYGDSVDLVSKVLPHGYMGDPELSRGSHYLDVSNGKLTNDTTYTVHAKSAGTTIVQVTYDSYTITQEGFETLMPGLKNLANQTKTMFWGSGSNGGIYSNKTYPANSKVNTGYIVFTVGENGQAYPESSIDNWRHYDTIYYTDGDTCTYSIDARPRTPAATSKMVVTCNGQVMDCVDGKYALPLENRDNIVGIICYDKNDRPTSTYRIISARKVSIDVTNKSHEGQPIKAGDTATVTFRGFNLPVNRVPGMYNPEFNTPEYPSNQAVGINYSNPQLGSFKAMRGDGSLSSGGQYSLDGASFDVTFYSTGSYTFTGSDIDLKWWGGTLGSDLVQPSDLGDNNKSGSGGHDSAEHSGKFCSGMLPSFTIEVQ